MAPNSGAVALNTLGSARSGHVVASFSRAIYLRLYTRTGPGLIALVTLDVPPGPLHVRVHALPQAEPGDVVRIRQGFIDLPYGTVDIPRDAWSPPPLPGLDAQRREATEMLVDLVGYTGNHELTAARASLARADLAGALAYLAGRGSGLTPAGDDCAAGIILATALLAKAGAATWSEGALRALVAGHDSHEISRAFLFAAAQGQSIEPIHRLLAACASSDDRSALRELRHLSLVGHTSGLDLAFGVMLGLEWADAIAEDWNAGVPRERMTSATQSAQ